MTEEYRSVLKLDISSFKVAASEAKRAVDDVKKALDSTRQTDTFTGAADSARDAAKAIGEVKTALDETKPSGAFTDVADDARDATSAVSDVKKAMDEARSAMDSTNQGEAFTGASASADEAANSARRASEAFGEATQTAGETESAFNGIDLLKPFRMALGFIVGFVGGVREELQTIREDVRRTGDSVVQSAEESTARIRNGPIENLKSVFSNLFSGIVQGARDGLSGTRRGLSGLGNDARSGAMAFLKYALGIRSIYALVRKLKSFAGEGLRNLAMYSASTNAAISSLVSTLAQLKNSLATAFAPIIEVVAPYIASFIKMVAGALTAVSAFFSALTGKTTYTRAVAVQQDYAAGLKGVTSGAKDAAGATKKHADAQKELNRQLMGFDQINKLSDNSSSGSGGGSGGGGGGSGGGDAGNPLQFVTEAIPGIATNWAEMLREAWANADFTEIGNLIGTKLRDALDSIPWDDIKNGAKRVAKSLATLLNGFLETVGLSTSIGNTVAEAFNTGFEFVNTFLENFHFDSMGRFITSGIQAALERFEWSQIGRTVSNLLTGALDFGQGALDGVRWSDLGGTIWTALKETFTNIDYAKISEKFFKLLGTAIQDARNLISGFFGSIAEDITDWATDDTGKIDFDKIAKSFWSGFKKALEVAKPASDFFASLDVPNPLTEIAKTWKMADIAAELLKPLKDKGLGDSFGEVASGIVEGFKTAFNDLPTYVEGVFNGIKKYLGGLKIDLNPFDGNGVGIKENISLTAAVTGEIVKAVDKTNGKAVVGDATAKAEKFKDDVHGAQVDNVTAKAEKFKDSVRNPYVTGVTAKASKFADAIKASKKRLSGFKATVTDVSLSGSAKSALKSALKSAAGSVTVAVRKAMTRAKGGVFHHGVWSDIPQYAGGTLNAGTVFAAGENGPEIVGHIGGRTEVLNKSQIASAIYSAMVSAIGQYKSYFSSIASSIAQIPQAVARYTPRQQSIPAVALGGDVTAQYTGGASIVESLAHTLAAQSHNGSGDQPIVVKVMLDGRQVAESTVREWQRQARSGRYPLSGLV